MVQVTSEAIQSTIESDFFSGYLYPHTVALQSGVRVLPARGNVLIPIQTGTTNVSNQSENTAISDTTGVTFSNLSMSPVRITAETIVSRQLIQQASLDLVASAKEDQARNAGATLDNYIFNATAGSQGFNGVFATSGTNVIATRFRLTVDKATPNLQLGICFFRDDSRAEKTRIAPRVVATNTIPGLPSGTL